MRHSGYRSVQWVATISIVVLLGIMARAQEAQAPPIPYVPAFVSFHAHTFSIRMTYGNNPLTKASRCGTYVSARGGAISVGTRDFGLLDGLPVGVEASITVPLNIEPKVVARGELVIVQYWGPGCSQQRLTNVPIIQHGNNPVKRPLGLDLPFKRPRFVSPCDRPHPDRSRCAAVSGVRG